MTETILSFLNFHGLGPMVCFDSELEVFERSKAVRTVTVISNSAFPVHKGLICTVRAKRNLISATTSEATRCVRVRVSVHTHTSKALTICANLKCLNL
jgi:hypothetical protein